MMAFNATRLIGVLAVIEIRESGQQFSLNAADKKTCLDILTTTITAVPADWRDIVKAVDAHMTIQNWLEVRGVLQGMINQGLIKRPPGIVV